MRFVSLTLMACVVDDRIPADKAGGYSTRNHSHFEQLHFIDIVPPNINISNNRVQFIVCV